MTNELGVFIDDNDRPVVSSRDIARVFEKEHKNVLQSIQNLKCPASFTALNFQLSEYEDSTGRVLPEYLITRDGFSFLVMGFNGEKAGEWKVKYIQAFNAMERELLRRESLFELPQTYLEALEALVAKEKERIALSIKVEQDKPKVAFADAVSASDTDILIRDLAKLLRQNGCKIGEKRLFERLRSEGYLIKAKPDRNRPTQRAMELGLFRVKERVIFTHPEDAPRTVFTTLVTPKGQQYFINRYCGEKD